jgi:hypothetical protein
MMSVGIRSGVNWTRLNFRFEHLGNRAHQQGLRHPGQADQQRVAAGNDAHQHLVEHLALADDHLADLEPDLLGVVTHLADQCQVAGSRGVLVAHFRGGLDCQDELAGADLHLVAG